MPLTRPKHRQLQTAVTNFDDPLIELNASHTGANTNDLGILFNRGSSGNNVGIIWDRSAQAFAFVQTTGDGDSSGDIVLSAYADLQVKTLATETFALPTADGTTGQVLTTDGLGNVTWEDPAGGGGGLAAVVDDTNPNLGGTLLSNGNDISMGTSDQILLDVGSNTNPAIAFAADLDTGLYYGGAELRVVYGSNVVAQITSSNFKVSSGTLSGPDGSIAAPGLSFGNAVSTGFSRDGGTNDLVISRLGTEAARFDSVGLDVTGNIAGDTLKVGGTAATTYAASIQSTAVDTWIEILNNGGAGQGAFFGMNGTAFQMWNYQGGQIDFWTNPSPAAGTRRLTIENNGTLNVSGTSNYEALVTHDDDIPNKKYVDDEIIAAAGNKTVDNFVAGVDFTAGTTTVLTLSVDPGSENNILVSFDGIAQHHTEYTLVGTTLTFTSAIPSSVTDVEVIGGTTLGIATVADGTITYAKLAPDVATTINAVVDNFVDGVDYTSGTTTQLTLSHSPGSENNIAISYDGVVQHHSEYSLAGAVVTFIEAIPLGTLAVEVVSGGTLPIGTPSDDTVTLAKLATETTSYIDDADALKLNLTGGTLSGNLSAVSFTASGTAGLAWESGRSRITHNDGGGNCQIRFGNEFSGSEIFTAAGSSACRIRQDIDSEQQPLKITVSNNTGVTNGSAVTWGSELLVAHNSLKWAGEEVATVDMLLSGRINSNGTAAALSSTSITVSSISTGWYRVTHNLGHTNYSCTATTQANGTIMAVVGTPATTYIDVVTYTPGTTTRVNANVHFQLHNFGG